MPKKGTKSQTSRSKGRRLAAKLFPGSSKPSNPSQVAVGMWLEGPATLVSSQASTGLSDTAYILPALANLTKASSWKGLFDEYRLTEVTFEIEAVGLNNGVTKFIIDDADSTSPDINFANERIGKLLSNNSSSPHSRAIIRYKAQDVTDLEWYGTNTTPGYTPCALKIYTDYANMGTSTSVKLYLIKWKGKFEFRGIGANQ